jgi:hypothetical protein
MQNVFGHMGGNCLSDEISKMRNMVSDNGGKMILIKNAKNLAACVCILVFCGGWDLCFFVEDRNYEQ